MKPTSKLASPPDLTLPLSSRKDGPALLPAYPLLSENRRPQRLLDRPDAPNKRIPEGKYRAGDWICNRCSNHNYSFRTVCNSCKAQTKMDNLIECLSVVGRDESGSVLSTAPVSPPESVLPVQKKRKLCRLNPNNYFKPAQSQTAWLSGDGPFLGAGNGSLWQSLLSCPGTLPEEGRREEETRRGSGGTTGREDSDASFDFDQGTLELHFLESE